LRLIPPRYARLIRSAPTIRRRSGVRKFELDLRRAPFHLAQNPLRVVGVVFMSEERVRSDDLALSLRSGAALQRLRRFQPYAAHQPEWQGFCKRVAAVPAFVLRRGRHPSQTVESLERLLSR
jgi:hypothetical protein